MKDEFEELQLLEDDAIVTAVDGRQRRLDHVWGEVMAMQTGMGAVRFPALSTVYTRSNLLPETITAYLQYKMNVDSCCYQMEVTPAMVRDAKRACSDDNAERNK